MKYVTFQCHSEGLMEEAVMRLFCPAVTIGRAVFSLSHSLVRRECERKFQAWYEDQA